MDFRGSAHLHTIITLVAKLVVLPTAQVRSLTSIPKLARTKARFGIGLGSHPLPWLQVGLGPGLLSSVSHSVLPDLLGCLLPSLTGTRKTSVLILQPSLLLSYTQSRSNKQPHVFIESHELGAWLCQLATSRHCLHSRPLALQVSRQEECQEGILEWE